ncbi:FG-GAP-like repeat-containing protein [Fulvivirga sp.]|uniref:FG-GAP-like repeat-containing protein n=1 Tax=Fulvivirga sp. TaxID=1931237 RepID=UPI0032EF09AF
MKSNLRVLYGTTLAKYSKFKSRYDKNVRNGHFKDLSDRKKSQIISKLKRLYNRLCQLRLQLKLAAATGILALGLTATQSATAQQLGPFVVSEEKNPLPPLFPNERDEQLAIADLDNDGDLDVIVGRNYGDIRFLENVGSASNPKFVNRIGVDNPFNGIYVSYYASPALADLDGDGDLDFVLGTNLNDLAFFENTDPTTDHSNPQFAPQSDPPHPVDNLVNKYGNYMRPSIVDIDNDGDVDIFVGQNYEGSAYPIVTFWLNDGTNIFTQQIGTGANPLFDVLEPVKGGMSRAYPTFIDIDGDNDQDAIMGDASGNIRFFRNDGNVTSPDFTTEVTGASNPFNTISTSYNASPEFADLDNDGDFDMIFGSGPYERLRFFENIGTSSSPVFEEKLGFENPLYGTNLGDFDIAPTTVDLDGDGFLDIVIGSKYEQTLFYFENNHNGTFTEKVGSDNPFENLTGWTTYEESPVPAFADIDGDLDFDLFLSVTDDESGPNIPEVKLWSNDGSNNFTPVTSPITTYAYSSKFSTTVNDFDDDGDVDAIIGTPYFGGSFIFSRNDGGATWVDQPSGNAPFFGVDIAAGITEYAKPVMVDLDHDGDLDVVAGVDNSTLAGQLVFFRNTNGVLLLQNFAANPFDGIDVGGESHPAFIDIDNDGDQDVLIGEAYGDIAFVENQNESPTLSLAAGPINYTEGDGPVSIDALLNVTDDAPGEGDLIQEARIRIVNYVNGQDVLTFTSSSNPDANITGIFQTTGLDAGTLILTGMDTLKNFIPVMRSIMYENTSIAPNTTTRIIEFSVTDWDNTNPSPTSINININADNSAPIITASSAPNAIYNEDDSPGVIIDGGLIVSDVDNTTLSSATVQITTNFQTSEDVLEFTDQNGITGSYNATIGLLTLTGSASVANYQTALRSVRYSNTSQDPNNTNRTIRIRVNDGTINSNLATRIVEVVPINDAPVVSSSNTTTLDYDHNTTAIVVDDLLDIIDVDDTQLVSATVTITGYQTGDILAGTAPTGGSIDFDAGTGILTLSGTATLAEYISALSTVTFSSDQSGSRQLNFSVNDGTNDSNIYSRDLNIIVPNEAPVIASTGSGSIDYEQNAEASILDNSLTINDPDDTNIESVSVSISGYLAGDTLTISEPTGTTSSFDDTTGILMVTGSAPIEDYEAALQSLSFASTNGAGARQILIVANDGDDNSNTFTIDVNISDEIIPQPPVVNTTPATTQEGSRLTIDLCAIISDPDNTFDELTITVVSITSGAVTSIDGCDLVIDYEGLDFSGTDSIVLSATDPDGNTDQNTLSITVEEEPVVNGGDLLIYNAISPNGDGANDWWEIVNLTTPNKIELYNRWGDLVKTLNNYENIENNSQLDDLPVGTYFYKISSPQGEYTGYITIKK